MSLHTSKKTKIIAALLAIFNAAIVTAAVYPYNAKYLDDGGEERHKEQLLFFILSIVFYAAIRIGIYVYKTRYGKNKTMTLLKKISAFSNRHSKAIQVFVLVTFVLMAGFLISANIKPIQPGEAQTIIQQYLDDVISGRKQINDKVTEFKPTGYELVESDGKPPGRNRLNEVYVTYALTNDTPFVYMYVVLNASRPFFWTEGKANVLRTETEIAGLSSSARDLAIAKRLINDKTCGTIARTVLADPNSTEKEKNVAITDRNLCIDLKWQSSE